MEFKVNVCRNCGNTLDLRNVKDGIIECEYCGSVFTVPKKETNAEALSFLRIGEHNLNIGNWDSAMEAFKKAYENDKNESEILWDLALADYKVQYIKDVVNKRLQPICYEISDRKFSDSKYYRQALDLATPTQRAEYQRKAEEIEYIKEEFYRLQQSGLEYDCFICVKVTDENGDHTEDYKDADNIYNLLRDKGFKPFFSERDIRNKTGADYEARILYALYSAETMLVVCRKEEYLKTPWVKNEYSRFLKLVNDEEKESDSITIIYYGHPIDKLPGKNGKIQGIDFSLRESDGQIIDFVNEHTPQARAKREAAEQRRLQEAEEIRRQIEESKKAQREFEERLKNLSVNNVVGTTSTVETLLTRGNQEMEAGDWNRATHFFETVLERAPENAAAWWGLFLCECEVADESQLLGKINEEVYLELLKESKNYRNAVRYKSGAIEEKIDVFRNSVSASLTGSIGNLKYEIDKDSQRLNKVLQELKEAEQKDGVQLTALKEKYQKQCNEYNIWAERKKDNTYSKISFKSYFISFLVFTVIAFFAWLFSGIGVHEWVSAYDELNPIDSYPLVLRWAHNPAGLQVFLYPLIFALLTSLCINLPILIIHNIYRVSHNKSVDKFFNILRDKENKKTITERDIRDLQNKYMPYTFKLEKEKEKLRKSVDDNTNIKNFKESCLNAI